MHFSQATPNTLIPIVVVATVVVLRMRRMGRMRRLRIEWLWIVPALYSAAAVAMFVAAPPSPVGWALSIAGLALGAVLGWQRGRMMHIHVDPETHEINQRASPAAMLFLLALVAVRFVARSVGGAEIEAMHLNPLILTDVLIAMAWGLLSVSRLEMYLRARRMLDEARA
ncbi:MAG: CcdC protein domain-containing protein [Pseudomonadota bacterium]